MTPELLVQVGILKNTKIDLKILGQGDLTKKLTVSAHGFSASAREKIESAGGTVVALREPKVKKAKPAKAKPAADGPSRTTRRDEPRSRRPSTRRRAAEPEAGED